MTAPEHLSTIARAEWDRLVLEQKDTLTFTDAPALAAYCAAYGRWVEAEKRIQESGTVVKDKAGKVMTNPYVAIAEQSLSIMHRFLSLLQHKQSDSNAVF